MDKQLLLSQLMNYLTDNPLGLRTNLINHFDGLGISEATALCAFAKARSYRFVFYDKRSDFYAYIPFLADQHKKQLEASSKA